MKTFRNASFFIFFLLCLFLFKPRQDIVLGAIDESQYLKLYEEGRDFVLGVDENNIFTGNYAISMDTVFLFYQEHLELSTTKLNTGLPGNNQELPKKLRINESETNIKSVDGTSFSAMIYKDIRFKMDKSASRSIPKPNGQKAQVLAPGSH
jgi:hypothetical protein